MADHGKVLIASEDEAFLHVHVELLRDNGYACDGARELPTAKRMLRQNLYDLLIADTGLPGNEELNFIEELPSLVNGLPVILVTDNPSLNTAIKSIKLSVSGYLVKPMPIEDFLKQVRLSIIRHDAHLMFEKARKRLLEMYIELEGFEGSKKLAHSRRSLVDVDVFLHYTIENIVASIIDLKDLVLGLAENRPKEQVCQLLNCPRHFELTEVIRDAIAVLERTKHSFKSKEIAGLRMKLQRVLDKSG